MTAERVCYRCNMQNLPCIREDNNDECRREDCLQCPHSGLECRVRQGERCRLELMP